MSVTLCHRHPGNVTADPNLSNPKTSYLCWDRANLAACRELTRVYLSQIMSDLCEAEKIGVTVDTIDLFYDRVISASQFSSEMSVPRCHKNFLKFWWDQEMVS